MTHLSRILRRLLCAILCLQPLAGQAPQDLAQLDPSDLYFQAWMLVRDAEKLEIQKKYVDSFENYRKARTLFDNIAINHPNFRNHLVASRQKTTKKALDTLRPLAIEEQKKKQQKFEGLIEDPKLNRPLNLPKNPADIPNNAKISDLDLQISSLKKQVTQAMNDRDANAARARRALAQLEAEKKRAISAPVKAQMDALNQEIRHLTRERDTLSHTLTKTQVSLRQSQKNLELTKTELLASRKKEADLLKLMEEQRNVNFKVIQGQQQQLTNLQKQMIEKDKLLAKADARIRNLTTRLEESIALVDELRTDRDNVLKERDQMAALLKINAADRVQELINHNVSLTRDLREANQKLQILNDDTNATKDQLLEAQRTIAVAKSRILRLQEDSTAQKLRLKDLQKKLDNANRDLLAQNPTQMDGATQEEIKFLKNIIKKQKLSLKVQEEAKEIILAQAEREGLNNENWEKAVSTFKGTTKPVLTEEEENIIANAGREFHLINRYRPSEAERLAANNQLQRDKLAHNRLAKRAFSSERMEVAAELFDLIIEDDPGDWGARLNLGIVKLRQNNPTSAAEQFREAILIKGNRTVPHAHFLLGVSYLQAQLYDDAKQEMHTALNLKPDNAKAHVFLGNIAGIRGNPQEAEHHFKEAMQIDPTLSEPHINLAVLRYHQGKKKAALDHYRNALQLGAAPMPLLEEKLGS